MKLQERYEAAAALESGICNPDTRSGEVGQLVAVNHLVHVLRIDIRDLQFLLWRSASRFVESLPRSSGEEFVSLIALRETDFKLGERAKVWRDDVAWSGHVLL